MRSHREVELKWVLTAAEHARLADALIERLGRPRDLDQRNRFFDAADGRLRRAGLSVRLRREGTRLTLTCKRKPDADPRDGLFSHDEWERELDPSLWDAAQPPQPGLAEALRLPEPHARALAGAPLVALGGFDNRRLEWHDGDELVCLDRTGFGARVDHELEVETPRPDDATRRWRETFARLGIEMRAQTETKLARYLASRDRRPPAG